MWLFLLVPTTNGPNSSTNARYVKSGATRSQVKQNTACCSLIAFPLLPAFCNFIFQTTCCPPRIQSAAFGGRAGAENPVQSGPNSGFLAMRLQTQKLKIAGRLRETTITLHWIARELKMGAAGSLANLLRDAEGK